MKDITHSAIRFTLIGAALAAALASTGAHAQNNIADGLIVGEMAGACRIMKQLVLSEEVRGLQGGGELVLRLIDSEAAHFGWTRLGLIERCKEAAAVYAELTAEPAPASGTSTTAEFILAGQP